MKIVINAASLKSGGGARYISEFVRELRTLNLADEFLIFLPPEPLKREEVSNAKIRLDFFGKKRWWQRLLWEQVTLRRIVMREKADVLFSSANFGMLFCPIAQILLVQTAIYSSPQYQLLARTFHLKDRISLWSRKCLLWLTLKNADVVMVPTRDMLAGIKDWLRRLGDRMIVNPYGVRVAHSDHSFRSEVATFAADTNCVPCPRNHAYVNLVFVSIYYEHKNLGTLLKSVGLLNRNCAKGTRFVLTTTANPNETQARHSAMRSEDMRLCDAPDIKPWLHFVGQISQDEADALYTTADIVVFPSVVESFGFPLLEAMAHDVPVVAADTAVNREICQGAALYFCPFNAEDLAAQIRKVATDSELRAQLCLAGRTRASQFCWEKHVKAVVHNAETLYRDTRKSIVPEHTAFERLSYFLYERLPVWAQNLATSTYGRFVSHRRFGRGYSASLRAVLAREEWTRGQILQYRDHRLRQVLEHSLDKVSYYRRVAQERGLKLSDFRSAKDLSKLPVLAKRDVVAHAQDLLAADLADRSTISLATSGSTGVQLRLLSDRSAQQQQWAVWWRYRMKHGLTPAHWCGCFAGRVIVPASKAKPPFWRVNYPAKQVLYSAYHMSDNALWHYVDDIRNRKLEWLHGYPSVLTVLARYLVQRGIVLPMKWVTVGAENLSTSQKALIETAFGCRCYQHYGCVEGVANFSECVAGNLHADEDICAIELIPTIDPERYMIVGTNLLNFAMPLIRYDTGDLCTRPLDACACGREGLCITRIAGRSNDVILLKDGRPVGTLDEVFEFVPNLYEAQITQSRPGHARISLVSAPKWSQTDEQVLLKEFQRRVGSQLEIEIHYTSSLERTRTGKVRMIVSRAIDNNVGTISEVSNAS